MNAIKIEWFYKSVLNEMYYLCATDSRASLKALEQLVSLPQWLDACAGGKAVQQDDHLTKREFSLTNLHKAIRTLNLRKE